jgi:hypothetical protein
MPSPVMMICRPAISVEVRGAAGRRASLIVQPTGRLKNPRERRSGACLAIIDIAGMTTGRNLSKPEEAREFFAPIIELAHKTATPFLGLTHLSANTEALGVEEYVLDRRKWWKLQPVGVAGDPRPPNSDNSDGSQKYGVP